MKKYIASILLVAACTAPPPPVLPDNSQDIKPPADAKKSDVYWRNPSATAPAGTGKTSTPSEPQSQVPDWTNPNDFRTFNKDLTAEAAGLPDGNPLKSLKQKTLANGLRVYAVANKELPLFAATLYVPGGSVYDSKEKSGLAALTADLLNKGANGKDAQQIALTVESLGASLGVSAGREAATLSVDGLSRDAATLLGLLADVTFKPTLSAEEFARAQEFRVGSLLDSFDDQATLATDALMGHYFEGHPYGLPSEGTPETVKALTLDDIKKFHASHYIPNNSFLVIVGDLNPEEAISLVEKSFSGWNKGAEVGALPEFKAYPTKKQVLIVDKPDATQVQIRIAWKGVAAGFPEEDAIEMINTTLGGGFTSHLVDELRVNNGYVYGVGSGMRSFAKGGAFTLRTATKLASVRPAIDLALKVITDYRATKQTETEFNGAKAYVSGQFPLGVETNGGLAASLAEAIFVGQGPKRISEYTNRIKSISQDKAKSTIETFVPAKGNPYLMVLVGPADQLKKAAEGLGEITVVQVGKHVGF